MAEIIVFTPKAELAAAENLRGFVAMCRDELTVFGADLPFDDNAWDITGYVELRGQSNKRIGFNFSNLATVSSRAPSPMQEPFLSFAKGYVRYMQGMRPIKNVGLRVGALRMLETALSENGEKPDPIKVDAGILNRAAQLAVERLSEGAAYSVGGQLKMVADFMSANRLTGVPVRWDHGIKRPADTVRVGKKFDDERSKKLPSPAALEALPKIFHLATEPVDVIVSSVAAILCSAPDRINEVLLLPVDCEVRQPRRKGEAKPEVEAEAQAEAYGLRWWPAKGADPMVKWVMPSMAGVVAEAIAKIKRCTEPARTVAKWYEANPDQIYLPEQLEPLRSQELLSMRELGEILWTEPPDPNTPRAWCMDYSVPLVKQGRRIFARFVDIERAVLALLPIGFPVLSWDTGLKCGEALMLVRRNELGVNQGTFRCVVHPVSIGQISRALGSIGNHHERKSVFDRFGFAENDGTPIKVRTHQFRHYLNTLAQAGGLSQIDIAKWSGRKDIRQNQAYDHVTADQMVAKIREAIGDEQHMFGPLAALPKNILIPRDEFARLKIRTAHTTDFGFCVHDYVMAPCQLYVDCINCEEHVCVKGDAAKTAMLRQRLDEAKGLLANAKKAVQEGDFGGDRWTEHHSGTVERLSQLCSILDDPTVPVGSVIQLSNLRTLSRIEQAAESRLELKSKSSELEQPDAKFPLLRNLVLTRENNIG